MIRESKVLEIAGIRKSYSGVTALAGVDLEAGRGEVMALLGPNGAGKTTLVSIVAALQRPDSGRVRIDGIDVVAQPGEARRRIGLAPQDTGIYPVLTVAENLRYFGTLGGLRGRELRRRIVEVAEAFALGAKLNHQARTLSGGEARRLHTAMSLMNDPPLLLLDEPTAGVDVHTRSQLLDVVRTIARRGTCVCYSTHYLGEVEELGATVAILDQGRIVARDSLASLISSFGQPAVELQFNGQVPPAPMALGTNVSDTTLRIATDGPPAQAAGTILARLGAAATRVKTIRLVEPNLETVYLAVTGKPFAPEPGRAEGHASAT